MNQPAGKLLKFINKSFSVGPADEWNGKDYAKLLSRTASYQTYVETVPSLGLPDADSLHRKLKEDSGIDRMRRAFRRSVELDSEDKVILILDLTHDPFYGDTRNPWVHEYEPQDGCTGSFEYLAASVVCDGERRFLDAKILNQFSTLESEVGNILDRIDFPVKAVLLDRGLAKSSRVLKELDKRDLDYLGLYPKYSNVKEILEESEGRFLERKFEVRDQDTRLVAFKDPRKDYWWTWVGTMDLGKGAEYLRLYRKRWNIETGFRVRLEARVKSKSVDPRLRYFSFLVELVLYNRWKGLEVEIQFKRWLILLSDSSPGSAVEQCGCSGGESVSIH